MSPDMLATWKALRELYEKKGKTLSIKKMASDPERSEWVQHISTYGTDLYVDYSRHLVDQQILDLLLEMARDSGVAHERDLMFAGTITNKTENRPALHMALRCPALSSAAKWSPEISEVVRCELERMRAMSELVRTGAWKGYSGERITSVVNIGIGGSDLGPRMVCQALQYFTDMPDGRALDVYFVSNIDGNDLESVLKRCHPPTTLFIIVSKTFTTLETLANARSAKNWVLEYFNREAKSSERHFVAVSTNVDAVVAFGIPNDESHIFVFWDWVGGRYSLWSAAGLSICLYIGYENFCRLLDGARAVDEHFLSAPFEKNVPVILAVLGIWYNNFYGAETQAILPYEQLLSLFPGYLQQLEMESNGKSVMESGSAVGWHTAPIIWGGVGTDAQHSFYQSFHQGTRIVPCDFFVGLRPCVGKNTQVDAEAHHRSLFANCIAQMEALSEGWQDEEPHRVVKGNKPSTGFFYSVLNPQNLGALIAIYEHKVFVQGKIWRIDSYDQWGVELGKRIAKDVAGYISAGKGGNKAIATQRFIDLYLEYNK